MGFSLLHAQPRATHAETTIEQALASGDIAIAESLFTASEKRPGTVSAHRRALFAARLAASRGDWKNAEARLRAWETSSARREGSGEILFWSGWAALHQGRDAAGDSLLVLASAYADEARAQQALEYRFAAMLDNSPALRDYLRGLPESPLPTALRIASLEKVPESSRLHPEARWHLALLLEARGDTLKSVGILTSLARGGDSPASRRAAARLAERLEKTSPDSAASAYESLLLQQQQGVSAETARERLKSRRNSTDTRVP